MAWYPHAIRKEIPPGGSDPGIIPVGMVLHVRAGLGDSLFSYFDGPSGGIESHFYVRFDGTVEQYRDTTREADANYRGNSWVSGGKRYGLVSVETEGLEKGEWTDAQVASLKALYRWGMDVHGWPSRVCPAWNQGGLGYHVMWGAPGPWTPVSKSCPGPDRVRQFNAIFRPWLAAGASEEDDVTPDDLNKIRAIIRAEIVDAATINISHTSKPVNWSLGHIAGWVKRTLDTMFSKPVVNIASSGKPVLWGRDHVLSWLVRALGAETAKTDAILRAVSSMPGVDGQKLAAEVNAAAARIDADRIVDELAARRSDDE